MMMSWRVKEESDWDRISVNLKKQKNQERITFHIQINVDSFSDDSTESNDVLDANDVVVLDGSPVKRNSSHIRNLF